MSLVSSDNAGATFDDIWQNVKSPESGLRVKVSPYSRSTNYQMLKLRRFSDLVPLPETQNYRFIHNLDFLLWWLTNLFQENLRAKAFKKIMKSWKKNLWNHSPEEKRLNKKYIA